MKKYQYVLKEPYDPKWLEDLKNTELVEYKFNENTKKLSKRRRDEEDDLWSQWSQCCKHGKDLKNCKNCHIKIEKIYKRKEIDRNASRNEQNKQRKSIYNLYGKKLVKERELETRKKRKIYLSSLNYKDNRNSNGMYCSICCRKKIPIEDYEEDYILPKNCVYATSAVDGKYKKIYWHPTCIECVKNIRAQNYKNGGYYFDAGITKNIRRHLNNTIEEAKLCYKILSEQDNNRCYTCNAELIKKGKIGFNQFSINKLHPNLKESDILHLSCLACNLCQNDLPYCEFLKYIILIINNDKNNQKNTKKLNKVELQWIEKMMKPCPKEVRLYVVEKYGRYCIYSGLEILFESNQFNTASFDRIDSKLPYTNDQVQLVCKNINFVKKGAINESELLKWIENLKQNRIFIQKRYYQHELLNKWNSLF